MTISKKTVFGLTRRELFFSTIFFLSTSTLIIFSTIRLVNNHYNQNRKVILEIQEYSKNISYLNEISVLALNTQRSTLNLLIYKNNFNEIADLKAKIIKNRDSLTIELNKIESLTTVEEAEKSLILKSGLNYLSKNASFLRKLNDSLDHISLSNYNLDSMRPVLRSFSNLNNKSKLAISEKIKTITNDEISIFYQIEFWLLLIGLTPYLYFFYRIISLIIKLFYWEFKS